MRVVSTNTRKYIWRSQAVRYSVYKWQYLANGAI